jgi:hypothetical protein
VWERAGTAPEKKSQENLNKTGSWAICFSVAGAQATVTTEENIKSGLVLGVGSFSSGSLK